MSDNICVINAKSGIGTSSPQISQFTNNCDCIKFVIDKDFTSFALVVISSINGEVSVVSEGEYLSKSFDSQTGQTTALWYPSSQITKESGCLIYQLAAYDTTDNKTIWYSKEGRLIVTDSIDTNDYSAAQVGSQPNLVTQILTLAKSLEHEINTLSENKVDKSEGKMLSSNDFTDMHIEKLDEAHSTAFKNTDLIGNIHLILDENTPEESYTPESKKAQSGIAVAQAIAGIVNSAPETLNTLEELAKALGNDPNFATSIMTLLGGKVDKENGKVLSSNDFSDEDKETINYLTEQHEILLNELGTSVYPAIEGKVDKSPYFGLVRMEPVFDEETEEYTWDSVYIDALVNTDEGNTAEIGTCVYSVDGADKELKKKVDKIEGKGLSTNDFTDDYVTRISAIETKTDSLQKSINDVTGEIDENDGRITNLESSVFQAPITTIPATLEPNRQYNFGEVTELALSFPSIAEDGDVVYITFSSGATATTLTIDTTNTCDIEIIPEKNTGYEVFGKFNGSIWIVNYSEYTVSEG